MFGYLAILISLFQIKVFCIVRKKIKDFFIWTHSHKRKHTLNCCPPGFVCQNPGRIITLIPCNEHPCFSDVNAKQQQFIQEEQKQSRMHSDLLYIIKLFALKMKGSWSFAGGSSCFSRKGIQRKFIGLEEIFITLQWKVHEFSVNSMACRKKKRKKIQIIFPLVFPPYSLSAQAYFPLGYKYFPNVSHVAILGLPCTLIHVRRIPIASGKAGN